MTRRVHLPITVPSGTVPTPSAEKSSMTRYGVLISEKETSKSLGVIELDPSGMMITAAFEGGPNPHSMGKFADHLLDQPIYKKYADVLARDKVLSPDLMMTETQLIAGLINRQSMTLGGVPVVARSVQQRKQ